MCTQTRHERAANLDSTEELQACCISSAVRLCKRGHHSCLCRIHDLFLLSVMELCIRQLVVTNKVAKEKVTIPLL